MDPTLDPSTPRPETGPAAAEELAPSADSLPAVVVALPADPLHAEKDALRIQAAAVAAQQAALMDEEARLQQRRSTLDQQEAQLAAHLEDRRRRLVQMAEETQAARTALHRERQQYEKQVQKITSDLGAGQRELLEKQQRLESQKQRLHALRRRLGQRWRKHWQVEHTRLQRRETELKAERGDLRKQAERLREQQIALYNDRLVFNGESELGKRQLQDAWQRLHQERQQWEAERARQQAELKEYRRALEQRATALKDAERDFEDEKHLWKRNRAVLQKETEGLDHRIRNQRARAAEQQEELTRLDTALRQLRGATPVASPSEGIVGQVAVPQAVLVSALPLPANPQRDAEQGLQRRAEALERLAGELADQRLLLAEQWQLLVRTQEQWQTGRGEVIAGLEALTLKFPQREQALAVREQALEAAERELRRRYEEATYLRHHLEGWRARLRLHESSWESERDRMLADLRGREELAERHLRSLVELRQRWAKRRRQELDLLRAERAVCEKLRQECAAMREDWWRRSTELEEDRRVLAEKTLALEQYRQESLLRAGDVAAAERRTERLRRRWVTQNAEIVRATAEARQALHAELVRLEERYRGLQRQNEAVAVREANVAQRQTAWEEAQALAEAEQARLQQQLHSTQNQSERYLQHLRELEDEVERIALVLLEQAELPGLTGQAA